jgi:hypothetical protein
MLPSSGPHLSAAATRTPFSSARTGIRYSHCVVVSSLAVRAQDTHAVRSRITSAPFTASDLATSGCRPSAQISTPNRQNPVSHTGHSRPRSNQYVSKCQRNDLSYRPFRSPSGPKMTALLVTRPGPWGTAIPAASQ